MQPWRFGKGTDIWPDLTSHSLPPNIWGPLVNQEHYSCTVHDSKKSVVLLNTRVNQIVGWWASSSKSCSHAALCQASDLPNCGPRGPQQKDE